MSARRRVRVDREGRFQIAGHAYTLTKSTHGLTAGEWEVWDDDHDSSTPFVRLASPGRGPGRPLATAPSYREIIDQAAERGRF